MNLRYYNYDVHKAAFVLPQFARKVRFQYSFFNLICNDLL